jgi:16S rRNA (cytosine967-C5)-methyltransferase
MTDSRHIAVQILLQVEKGHQTLDRCLDIFAPPIEGLDRADRALAHALIYGVLRWKKRLDWIIDRLARQPSKIDPLVRTILQLGLFQILFMDRIPHSAAVHTAVELAKREGRAWAAGFVNGLLRRAAREPEPTLPDPQVEPQKFLAVDQAFPCWLIARWLQRFGHTETEALCRAMNAIPAITLRVNTLRAERNALLARIAPDVQQAAVTEHTPEGIRIISPRRPLLEWETFKEGAFQVQDEAAQLIAHLLSPRPGEQVWDTCAGLGTKCAHVAQLMENKGSILATDSQKDKLSLLEKEMRRLGIDIVTSAAFDLTRGSTQFPDTGFDRILVDAPCSGLGVLQKNPDGKWRHKPQDLLRYGSQQIKMLAAAAQRLRPGGVLVYAVCSFEPEENAAVVNDFLQNHPEFDIQPPMLPAIERADLFISSPGFVQTSPHRHRMDGFFAVALTRR